MVSLNPLLQDSATYKIMVTFKNWSTFKGVGEKKLEGVIRVVPFSSTLRGKDGALKSYSFQVSQFSRAWPLKAECLGLAALSKHPELGLLTPL